MGGRRDFRVHIPAFYFHPGSGFLRLGSGSQGQAGYRADTGQGFTPKAEGTHRFEVVQSQDLAGGVAAQGQGQVRFVDTGTVITNPDQLDPALLDLDIYPAGPCIQGILYQLFNYGCRALHHLAGGYLVGKPGREQLDVGHNRELPLDQDEGIRMVCPTITRSSLMPLKRMSSLTVV